MELLEFNCCLCVVLVLVTIHNLGRALVSPTLLVSILDFTHSFACRNDIIYIAPKEKSKTFEITQILQ